MNGILLVDKPQGWTSSDVVIKLKGIMHQRRIGHGNSPLRSARPSGRSLISTTWEVAVI